MRNAKDRGKPQETRFIRNHEVGDAKPTTELKFPVFQTADPFIE